jgi:hypothetical protein
MMRKFPLFEAACLAAMVAAPVALGLVLSTGSSAMAAEKEKKPAVAVACTAPCIDGNEIEAGAVGAADIATGAVGADAIGTGAVGADEISDGAIGVGKLGFDPATQDELESHVTLGNLTCGEGQAVKMVSLRDIRHLHRGPGERSDEYRSLFHGFRHSGGRLHLSETRRGRGNAGILQGLDRGQRG